MISSNDSGRLQAARRVFARQIVAAAGVESARIQEAFSLVPREDFMQPPWVEIGENGQYRPLEDDDPIHLYQDKVFAIDGERSIHNGMPSLHVRMLAALNIRPGSTIAHLGAGAGYYSAILSHLAGNKGRVIAIEFEEDIAKLAENNLSTYPNVFVICGDAAKLPDQQVDCIYTNFAVTEPSQVWFSRLNVGGNCCFRSGFPPTKFFSEDPRSSGMAEFS